MPRRSTRWSPRQLRSAQGTAASPYNLRFITYNGTTTGATLPYYKQVTGSRRSGHGGLRHADRRLGDHGAGGRRFQPRRHAVLRLHGGRQHDPLHQHHNAAPTRSRSAPICRPARRAPIPIARITTPTTDPGAGHGDRGEAALHHVASGSIECTAEGPALRRPFLRFCRQVYLAPIAAGDSAASAATEPRRLSTIESEHDQGDLLSSPCRQRCGL